MLCSEQNIYVYVDGQRVFEYRNNAFDLGEGYISLHSGTMPVTFENLRIIDLSEGEYALPEKQEAITGAEYDAEVSVDKYTLYSQVLEQLPETIAVTDTNGDVTEMGVEWSCPDYDKNTTGSYFFTGEIRLPDGDKFLNLYGVKPKLTGFGGVCQRLQRDQPADRAGGEPERRGLYPRKLGENVRLLPRGKGNRSR